MSIVALYGDEKVPKKGKFMGRSLRGVSGIARNAAVAKPSRNNCLGRAVVGEQEYRATTQLRNLPLASGDNR